ncbi:MAG: carbohydrate-binding domain-containing protein [Chloroflexota bacterium]
MVKKAKSLVAIFMLLVLLLAACTGQSATTSSSQAVGAAETTLTSISTDETAVTVPDTQTVVVDYAATEMATATAVATAESVAEATLAFSETHDDAEDYVVDSTTATQIMLSGEAIAVEGAGVTVNGRIATITAAGTYTISGTLAEGQIVVDTEDEEIVQLVLAGVRLSSSSTAPLYIANAEETISTWLMAAKTLSPMAQRMFSPV